MKEDRSSSLVRYIVIVAMFKELLSDSRGKLLQALRFLREAPRKYQLDLEIAKKSNFSKLAHNEALRAIVTQILF